MKVQTHAKLYLREIIDNWKYIDGIIFLIILLIYVGYTDPCDRCMVRFNDAERSCKDAFMSKIGLEQEENGIIHKTDYLDKIKNFTIIEDISPIPSP